MLETNVIIDEMNVRKVDLDNTMLDIANQQKELDIRRSRIEGKIYEIEYLIRRLEETQKETTGTTPPTPPIVPSGGSQYHGTRI